jgi:hypothetical protein
MAALVVAGLGFAGLFAIEQGPREVHRNAVVVSVTTQATEAGGQSRVLVVDIPDKHDTLTFTIPSTNKELFEAVGGLHKGDRIVVAIVLEDGKYRLREFARAK